MSKSSPSFITDKRKHVVTLLKGFHCFTDCPVNCSWTNKKCCETELRLTQFLSASKAWEVVMWNLKCLCYPLSRHASMTPGSDQNWSRLLNKSKSSTDCRDQAQEGACQEQEAVRQEKMDGLQNEFICNPLPEKALGLQTRPSSTWSGVFSVSGLIRIVQTLIQDLVMEIMLTFWTACMTPIETLIVWRDFLRRLRFQPSQSLRTVQSVNCQPPPRSTKEPPLFPMRVADCARIWGKDKTSGKSLARSRSINI